MTPKKQPTTGDETTSKGKSIDQINKMLVVVASLHKTPPPHHYRDNW